MAWEGDIAGHGGVWKPGYGYTTSHAGGADGQLLWRASIAISSRRLELQIQSNTTTLDSKRSHQTRPYFVANAATCVKISRVRNMYKWKLLG